MIKADPITSVLVENIKVDEDAETETYADDPNPYVTINGGNIDITTTGKPYDKISADSTSCHRLAQAGRS